MIGLEHGRDKMLTSNFPSLAIRSANLMFSPPAWLRVRRSSRTMSWMLISSFSST